MKMTKSLMKKTTSEKINLEVRRIDKQIARLNADRQVLLFELGRREDFRACSSDNPNLTCSYCTCWKRTRELCS